MRGLERKPSRDGSLRRTVLTLYLVFLAIYGAGLSDRLVRPGIYNHYTYLADSFLHGRLDLTRQPPHQNDWALHEGRWYVSFPPVPALLMVPGVALWGWDETAESPVPDHWQRRDAPPGRYGFREGPFNLLLAPFPPLLLFLILERLRRSGRSRRSRTENLVLVGLFGLGTVYFPAAVQADTWHIAHVVGCTFLGLYVLASLDGKHPLLAGLCLGLAFGCRTPMAFAFPFYVYEVSRACGAAGIDGWGGRIRAMARRLPLARLALFALAAGAVVGAWLLMNEARFGDPFDFGHRHLMIRWTPRIERWGLFDFHYLPRNLASALVLLPWAREEFPFFEIGHHGLAIWLTSPFLLYLLWPRKRTVEVMDLPPKARRLWPEWTPDLHWPLWVCVGAVAAPSLFYQNTGWVQFGYRFSNDYMLFFFMLLAIGGRRFTRWFWTAAVIAVVVCTLGAVTFNRVPALYNQDLSQRVFFQPD